MTGDNADKEQKKTSRRVISLGESKDEKHLRNLGFKSDFIQIVQSIDPDEAERRQTQERVRKEANATQDLGAEGLMDILTDLYKKREKDLAYLKDNLPSQLPEKYKNQIKNFKQGVDLLTFIIKKYDAEFKKVAGAEKEKAKIEQSRKKADQMLIEKVEKNTSNFFNLFGQFYTDTAERDYWRNTYKNKLMHFLERPVQERKCKVISDNGDFKIKIIDPMVALDVLMELYKYDSEVIANTLTEHDKLQREHSAVIRSLESRLPDEYLNFINLAVEKTIRTREKDRIEIQKDLDDASNMDKEELVKWYQDHRIELRALEDLILEHKNLVPGVEKLSDRVSKINRVLNILEDYKGKIDAQAKGLSESRESLQVFADNYLDAANAVVNDINILKNLLSEEAKIHIGQTAKQDNPLNTLGSIAEDMQKISSAVKTVVDDKNAAVEEYRKFTETTENRMKEYSEIFKNLSGIKEEKDRLEEQMVQLQQELKSLRPKAQDSEKYKNEIAALKEQISSNAEQQAYIKSLERQINSLKIENKSLMQRPVADITDVELSKQNVELKRETELLQKKLKKLQDLVEDAPEDVQLQEDKYAVRLYNRFNKLKTAFMKYNVANNLDPAGYAHARLPAVMAHEEEAFMNIIHTYMIFLTDFENLVNSRLVPLENQAKETYEDILQKLPRKMRSKNAMEARQNIIRLLKESEKRMNEYRHTKDQKISSFIDDHKDILIDIIKKKKQIEPDAEERLAILQGTKDQETNQEYYKILNFSSLSREISNAYNGLRDNEGNVLSWGISDFDETEDKNEGQKLAENNDFESFKDLKKAIEGMVENVGLVQQKKDFKNREEDFMSRFKYKTMKTVYDKLDALSMEMDEKTVKRLYQDPDSKDIARDYAECKEIVDLGEKIELAESELLSKAKKFDYSINTERRAINLVNRLVKKIAEYGSTVSVMDDKKRIFVEEYGFIARKDDFDSIKQWFEQSYDRLEDISEEPDEESRVCKAAKKLFPDKSNDYNSSIRYLQEFAGKPEFMEIDKHLSYFKHLNDFFNQDFNSAEALLRLIKDEGKRFRPYLKSLQAAQKKLYFIDQRYKEKIKAAKEEARLKKSEVYESMEAQKKDIAEDVF